MIYVRYIHNSNSKDEFLFCQPLESHTRGIDVFSKVDTFLYKKVSIGERLGQCAQMALFLCLEVILGSKHALDRLSQM